MDHRIAQRRRVVRKQRQHSRLRRTLTVLVLAAVATAAVVLERSPLLALADVRVEGTERLSPVAVEQTANLPLGAPSLRLDLGAAEDRVEALPLVAAAAATRVDPVTVAITVEERQPQLAATDGRRTVLVDADGVVLARGSAGGLPRIELVRVPEPGAPDREPALANAQAIYQALSGPLRALTKRYLATGPNDLELVLVDGTRVRFGRAERIDEKVRALGAVLEHRSGEPPAIVDVRAPAAPVVRPADSGSEPLAAVVHPG